MSSRKLLILRLFGATGLTVAALSTTALAQAAPVLAAHGIIAI